MSYRATDRLVKATLRYADKLDTRSWEQLMDATQEYRTSPDREDIRESEWVSGERANVLARYEAVIVEQQARIAAVEVTE